MKYVFLVFGLLFLLSGCKKDKLPDPPIIEPGSYFPVYPGSWWKYRLNGGSISIDSTSADYVVNSFKIGADPDKYSEPARVPLLNGNPIYKYDYLEEMGYPYTIYQGIYKLWPLLSEKVGVSFGAYYSDPRYGWHSEIVYVKSKTFNGTDSVLLLESRWESWNMSDLPERRYRTFTKGIGLTSDIKVDTTTSDTISKKILIDYYVNHPE